MAQKFGRYARFNFVDAFTKFSVLPTLEPITSIRIVVDKVSNQDGLEYDAAIVVGYGVAIEDSKDLVQLAKCRIYRAMTRARKVLALVNEPVKNGLLHSPMVDLEYKEYNEDLRNQESAKVRVLDLKDQG